MSLKSLALMTGLVLAVSGCASRKAEPEPAPDLCGAGEYQSFVGAPLAAVTFPDDLRPRILHPGDMMTMDYREDRMNIEVDEEGVIKRVWCG